MKNYKLTIINNNTILTSVIAIPIAETYKSFLIVVILAKDGVIPAAINITTPTIMVDMLADIPAPVFIKIFSLYISTTLMPLNC